MKYKVGEVANLLGLTTTAIRFYETEGVIKTKKEENGHRYYEIEDLIKLIQCKESRNREVPLKEITNALQNERYNHRMFIGNQMRNKLMLEDKIEYYQRLVRDLEDYIDQLCKMDILMERYELVQCRPTWFNGSPDGGLIDKKSVNNEVLREWVERLPFTKLGVMFDLEMDPLHKHKATLGLMIDAEEGEELRLPKSEIVTEIEKTLCIHTVVICKSFFKNPDYSLNGVIEYMNRKKLEPVGTAHGAILFHDNFEEETKTFVDLWIPVATQQ